MVLRSAVVIAAIFVVFAAVIETELLAPGNEMRLCQTKECRRAAARVLNAMDTTADPCNDFYQYACGRWLKNNPIPAEKTSITQFIKAYDKTHSILKRILSSEYTGDRDAIKKVKKFYKACMNEAALDRKDAFPAFDLMQQFGGFPLFGGGIEEKDFNLERYLAKTKTSIVRLLTSSPLLNVHVEVDSKLSTRHIMRLDQPVLGLPLYPLYLSDIYSSVQQAYRNYLHDFLKLLWENYDRETGLLTFDEIALNYTVNEVYQMEAELALIMDSNRTDVRALYNKMTVKEMTTEVSRDFNWLEYLKEVMAKADIDVDPSTEVLVTGKPYLSKMMSVLKKYNSRAIQNYVIIYNLVASRNLLSKKYRDTLGPIRKVLTGSHKLTPRWTICVSKVIAMLPVPVGAAYVQNEFPAKSKEVAIELYNNVVKSFRDNLVNVKWMDDQTRSVAEVKLNALAGFIGYPDYFMNASDPRLDAESEEVEISEEDFFKAEFNVRRFQIRKNFRKLNEQVDRNEWKFPTTMVNAYYIGLSNSIFFPAAIFQLPYFGTGQSFALNYGSVGSFIGHELTHGFDKIGSIFNESGNIFNWWSPATKRKFDQSTQCMKEQYSKSSYKRAGMFVNGNLTITENIADCGGIKLSFEGYQLWRKANPGREFQLPGLESFTPEQLFFIGNGQLWCAQETPISAKIRIIAKPHSPEIFRVEGPMKNYPEFGKAFGCKKGIDKLYPNPKDTCTVW